MKNFRYLLLSLILTFSFSISVHAQEKINAGLVSGIWFSEPTFFAGDRVRVYAAFQNQSGFDIEGTAVLLSSNKEVGETQFNVLNERLAEVWVDWTVLEGEQEISLQIKRLLKSTPDGTEEIEVVKQVLAEEKFFVDLDTDNDDIGNGIDIDDDNDGLTDEEELLVGTDQLIADTDSDGILDGDDTEPLVAKEEEGDLDTIGFSERSVEEASVLENITEKTKTTAASTDNLVRDISESVVQKVSKIQEERSHGNGTDDAAEKSSVDKVADHILFALLVIFSGKFLPYLLFFVIGFAVIKILVYLITALLGRKDEY